MQIMADADVGSKPDINKKKRNHWIFITINLLLYALAFVFYIRYSYFGSFGYPLMRFGEAIYMIWTLVLADYLFKNVKFMFPYKNMFPIIVGAFACLYRIYNLRGGISGFEGLEAQNIIHGQYAVALRSIVAGVFFMAMGFAFDFIRKTIIKKREKKI